MSGGQDELAYDQQAMREEAKTNLLRRLAAINGELPTTTGERHTELHAERERILDLLGH